MDAGWAVRLLLGPKPKAAKCCLCFRCPNLAVFSSGECNKDRGVVSKTPSELEQNCLLHFFCHWLGSREAFYQLKCVIEKLEERLGCLAGDTGALKQEGPGFKPQGGRSTSLPIGGCVAPESSHNQRTRSKVTFKNVNEYHYGHQA